MNILQVETAAPAAEPRFERTPARDAKEVFAVPPEETDEGPPEATRATDEAAKEDVPSAPTASPDVSAWMLPLFALAPLAQPAPPPPAPDLTDPSVQLAPVTPPPGTVSQPGEPGAALAETVMNPTPTKGPPSARESAKAATEPALAPTKSQETQPEASIVRIRTTAAEPPPNALPTAPTAPSAPRANPTPPRAKTAGTPDSSKAAPESDAPLHHGRVEAPPAVTTAPWTPPVATLSRGDNGLTRVTAPTPTAALEGADPVRARLQDVQTTAMNQRALQSPARGEVIVPELGRVAVHARAEGAGVDVTVQASHAAAAQALHASADALAADVRAADIPVARLTFEGAGTWTPSDTGASAREHGAHEGSPRGGRDPHADPLPRPAGAPRPGRVRIVL